MKYLLQKHRDDFVVKLQNYLKLYNPTNFGEEELKNAISYSLINRSAKYIRSFLVIEVAKMLGASDFEMQEMEKLALSVEMVHAYSLIHDDLPCMDNALERRGLPCLHKKFGESTAVLAGNALNTMAFQVLSSIKPCDVAVKIIMDFADTTGFYGLLSGQVLDLNADFKNREFEVMNYRKTVKLIEFCVTAPAALLFKDSYIKNLRDYGKSLGLAYQMQDDLLDEGEDGFSFINFCGTKEVLKLYIEQEIKKCHDAVSGFDKNSVLLNLPGLLAKRSM